MAADQFQALESLKITEHASSLADCWKTRAEQWFFSAGAASDKAIRRTTGSRCARPSSPTGPSSRRGKLPAD